MNASAVAGQGQVRDDLAYLTRLAGALTGRAQDSADLAHSAYLKALAGMPADVRSRRAYLRRVLVNLAIDDSHARGRLVEVPGEADRPTPGDPYSAVEARLDLNTALDRLPLLTRQILVLRYLEDQTVEDISQILGRPAGTIRRIAAEGRRRLSALLPVYNGKGPTP